MGKLPMVVVRSKEGSQFSLPEGTTSSIDESPAHPLGHGKGPVSIAQFNVICRSMTSATIPPLSHHFAPCSSDTGPPYLPKADGQEIES